MEKRKKVHTHTTLSLSLSLSLWFICIICQAWHILYFTQEKRNHHHYYDSTARSFHQACKCICVTEFVVRKEERGWSESRKEKFFCIWSNSLFVSLSKLKRSFNSLSFLLLLLLFSLSHSLTILLSYAFFPPLFNLRKICLTFHPSLHSHPHLMFCFCTCLPRSLEESRED